MHRLNTSNIVLLPVLVLSLGCDSPNAVSLVLVKRPEPSMPRISTSTPNRVNYRDYIATQMSLITIACHLLEQNNASRSVFSGDAAVRQQSIRSMTKADEEMTQEIERLEIQWQQGPRVLKVQTATVVN